MSLCICVCTCTCICMCNSLKVLIPFAPVPLGQVPRTLGFSSAYSIPPHIKCGCMHKHCVGIVGFKLIISLALYLLAAGIQYAMTYYPVFASLNSGHLLGYVLGTFYTWTLACFFVLDQCICHQGTMVGGMSHTVSMTHASM